MRLGERQGSTDRLEQAVDAYREALSAFLLMWPSGLRPSRTEPIQNAGASDQKRGRCCAERPSLPSRRSALAHHRHASAAGSINACRWPPGSGGTGRELAGFAPTSVPFEAKHDDGNRESPGVSLSSRPGEHDECPDPITLAPLRSRGKKTSCLARSGARERNGARSALPLV
jgi:hypothetical protein